MQTSITVQACQRPIKGLPVREDYTYSICEGEGKNRKTFDDMIPTQTVNASLRRLFWPGAVSQQVRRSAATPSLVLLAPSQNPSPLWMR